MQNITSVFWDMLLLLSTLVALVWALLPPRWRPSRWPHLLPTLNVFLALTHYWLQGLRPSIIPVYVCAGLLWLLTIGRLVRSTPPAVQRSARIRRILGIVARPGHCAPGPLACHPRLDRDRSEWAALGCGV